MKKYVFVSLIAAFIAVNVSLHNSVKPDQLKSKLSLVDVSMLAYATCPETSCDDDCDSGSTCQITQYDENGELCSTTTCHGKGPKWD